LDPSGASRNGGGGSTDGRPGERNPPPKRAPVGYTWYALPRTCAICAGAPRRGRERAPTVACALRMRRQGHEMRLGRWRRVAAVLARCFDFVASDLAAMPGERGERGTT
jgi:hypothetical protein